MDGYENLSPASRVWIYQSNRSLTAEEVQALNTELAQFAQAWTSHSQQLQSFAKVYHDHFLVLMVDESQAGASGCSIDKSVHFIQQVERKYGLNLMDRMTFAYKAEEAVQLVSSAEFSALYANGSLTDESVVFDNLVKTKAELEQSWEKPLKESWHKRFV